MSEKISREECLVKLRAVAEEKNELPKKSDFTQFEVMMIKSYFGPWPHALAAAGLIESKEEARIEKNRRRHLAAKQKRKEEKVSEKL